MKGSWDKNWPHPLIDILYNGCKKNIIHSIDYNGSTFLCFRSESVVSTGHWWWGGSVWGRTVRSQLCGCYSELQPLRCRLSDRRHYCATWTQLHHSVQLQVSAPSPLLSSLLREVITTSDSDYVLVVIEYVICCCFTTFGSVATPWNVLWTLV